MVGFSEHLDELTALGAKVYGASVDDAEKAGEVAAELKFSLAHSVSRADADAIGAWWEERRSIVQPSNFILAPGGTVLSATYSSGPIGRLEAADAVRFVTFQEAQKKKQAGG